MPPWPRPASRRCKRPCAGCEARIRWPLRGAAQSVAKNGVCCSCGKRRLCRFLLALALAPGHALAALHDGQVGGQKGVAHGLRERQAALEAAFGEVVVEDAANAALLVAVAVAKVFVAPRFEARVFVGAKGRQRALASGVKVRAVFVKAVVRRQIHAAAKPAGFCIALACRNHAHIHVHRGRVRVERVEHQRHAHRLERRARQLRPALRGRRRQAAAAHVRKANARALEHRAAFHDLRDAIALQGIARRFLPRLARKAPAPVGLFNGSGDARLQIQKIGAEGFGHDGRYQGRKKRESGEPGLFKAGGRGRRLPLLSEQEQIQSPENALIARFDGLCCYQTHSEMNACLHAGRAVGRGRAVMPRCPPAWRLPGA